MPNNNITLPASTQQTLTGFANTYGVSPSTVIAMAQVESAGNQNAVSGKGATGIMQLEPSTFAGLTAPAGTTFSNGQTKFNNINDPQQNMEAGVFYYSQQAQKYGDGPVALAAYNAGPGNVNKYGGVPPFPETQNYVIKVTGLAIQSAAQQGQSAPPAMAPAAVQKAINDSGQPMSPFVTKAQAIDPPPVTVDPVVASLQLPDDLMDALPWYDDDSLVTGNPHARKNVQPVSFKICLNQQTGQMLKDLTSGDPIQLQLNCSLTTVQVASKHVYNRTPSRTGQHVTFWGMQPDLLSGGGSTGVFMNQFGLTDFMSTKSASDAMKKQVLDGLVVQQIAQVATTAQLYGSVMQEVTDKSSDPANAFRVAAQDAFVELLKMFQMNGNVYFNNPDYMATGLSRVAPTGWSAQTGMSALMQNARNNDVFSRGYVAMTIKNNVYLGYFKSLNWSMDAEKPFQWLFDFVFQVERTYTTLYYPSLGVAPVVQQIDTTQVVAQPVLVEPGQSAQGSAVSTRIIQDGQVVDTVPSTITPFAGD
jgi:hypothetical protein